MKSGQVMRGTKSNVLAGNGKFVISLDFELLWGVRDKKSIEDYGAHIAGVREVIPKTLKIFNEYGIRATFSTVGFLFAEDKEELLSTIPENKPTYVDRNLSPYNGHLDLVGNHAEKDHYHYAPDLIDLIQKDKGHHIGTHTFSHYYCSEIGQTADQFKSDLQAAKKIAEKKGVTIASLVFPRNQCNQTYLEVLDDMGIESYSGNESFNIFKTPIGKKLGPLRRVIHFLDAYINLLGYHSFEINKILNQTKPANIPSSSLLRPYITQFSFLEPLKIRRIKKCMTHAAKNGKLYHLWWHPHNFGQNMEKNFSNLIQIVKHFRELEKQYGLESHSMESLTEKIND